MDWLYLLMTGGAPILGWLAGWRLCLRKGA